MSIPAGIDPSDFLDLHYCEECRKIGDFENDLCGECAKNEAVECVIDVLKFMGCVEEFVCNHCGQVFEAYKDEGGICSQCIKRDQEYGCDDV